MPEPPTLDAITLRSFVRHREERLAALETYGAGGCPTCHDAEARAFLAKLQALAAPRP